MEKLLNRISVDVTFRPDNGAFRSKLTETVIANTDEKCAELFNARNCDIQVSISSRTIDEGLIQFLVISDLGEQTLECVLSDLNQEELTDLEVQLSPHVSLYPPCSTRYAPKVIIRKNVNGMFDTHQAAQKLGCSQIFLKNKVPCTDYTYHEVNGKKEIIEYYWSQNLINRLCQIKLDGAKSEDVEYLADECCDGDCKWADEILISLVRPMRTPKVDGTLVHGITKRPFTNLSKGLEKPWTSRKKHS